MSRAACSASQFWVSRLALMMVLTTVFAVAALNAVTLRAAVSGSLGENTPRVRHIVVTVNKSQTIRFENPIKLASLGSTNIVDIQPLTNTSIYILAKKVGTTNISIFDENMQLVELLDVEVAIDTANLQEKIRASIL
jgi:pilus assembly protein CpaC